MLEEGVFRDAKPVAAFALHSFPDLEVGQIGFNAGPTAVILPPVTSRSAFCSVPCGPDVQIVAP